MNSFCTIRNFFCYSFWLLIALAVSLNCLAKPSDTLVQEPQTSAVQNNQEKTYSFKELGWDNSVTLNGYKPNYTFYLPISQYSNPQKAVLHLKLVFSPLLNEETQVEIKFNQTFLRRVTLPADVHQELNLDIELPLTQLSPDWQALDFTARLSSTKSLCNPDIWIYISPDSSLTLMNLELPFSGTLNHLSSLLLNPVSIAPTPILLLLPPNPASQELISLFRIALQLGQLAGDSKVDLTADFINESVQQQKDDNLILVGTSEHLFKEANLPLNTLSANQDLQNALNNNAGIILLNQSPFNPIKVLLTFTGKDYPALFKAVSAFLLPEFTKLSSGKEAIINTISLPEAAKPVGDWYQVSLEELGYSDQSTSGLGHHQLSYSIALPNNRIPTSSTLKTFITAPLLNLKDNSQITLLVNGKKQSSFQLNNEHSEWNVQIDASAMKPGINKFDYLFDLHFANEQCSLVNYDEAWATIHNETEFNTTFRRDFPQVLLNQLPVPFSSEVTVIIPEHLSKPDINNLTKLVFKLGQLIQPNPFLVNFLTASEANEDFIRHHSIILYGTVANNPWISFAAEYLPLQLKDNSRVLTVAQKEIQLSGGEHPTGLLELISSPWSEDHYVFLITGDNDAGITQAVKKIISDKARIKLEGNIALVNSDSSVELLKSDDTHYFSFKHQVLRKLIIWGKNTLYYVENHPQVFIYLLVILVPAYVFMKRRKKG